MSDEHREPDPLESATEAYETIKDLEMKLEVAYAHLDALRCEGDDIDR